MTRARTLLRWVTIGLTGLVCACGDDRGTGGSGTGSTTGGDTCTLTADTTETSVTSPEGCAVLDRDSSACEDARVAAGLSGAWLEFSCRVTLTKTTVNGVDYVEAKADGQPDHASNYFATSDPCHEDYKGADQNPNGIETQSFDVLFPLAPNETGEAMPLGTVGLALNGVALYSNAAAPGDDIYKESETFDRCQGHPQMFGVYHYHAEPPSLSYDDGRLIGFLRDGYPVYGRRDADGSMPTLDAAGGHTGTTPDSPSTPVYHYHLSLQTSQNPQSAGQQAWFITTGTYHGAQATCPSCGM